MAEVEMVWIGWVKGRLAFLLTEGTRSHVIPAVRYNDDARGQVKEVVLPSSSVLAAWFLTDRALNQGLPEGYAKGLSVDTWVLEPSKETGARLARFFEGQTSTYRVFVHCQERILKEQVYPLSMNIWSEPHKAWGTEHRVGPYCGGESRTSRGHVRWDGYRFLEELGPRYIEGRQAVLDYFDASGHRWFNANAQSL